MKISRIIMMVVLLLLLPVFALSSELGYMRVSLIKGDVLVKTPEAEEWGLASINAPLGEGDQVWVPDGGRAELQLNGGTWLRLDQNSSLQILSMDRDSSQFYLAQGHVYVLYDGTRGSVIQLDTADASTRAFDRSVFRIDVADQYTDIAVFKGNVETENDSGTTMINAGRLLSLGRSTEGEFALLDSPDSWEIWNRKRDARVNARNGGGARFLPSELRTYASDLDSNGRWTYVPEYGNVWTPTVTAGSDWSPYRQGRWLLRNGESVWVADEPWGWAPYHYGRWSYVVNIGWCWVPPAVGEVYWGPGYVGWVRTADYVAWVPLAPGEIYYGRRNYGPHSVNVTTVNINQVRVVNVYKNVYVNNGPTVVSRNSFNTASPAIVHVNRDIIQKNIFVTNNISIGAPNIKPARGAHYPSARSVPSDKLPPLRIRNLHQQEIKHERPLVKEHDRSVLAPGAQLRSLPVNRVDTPRAPVKERPALRQIQPMERRRLEASPGSRPRVEQPQAQPTDRRKPEALPGAFPRGDRPQGQPADQGKPGFRPGSLPRGEQPQFRPQGQRGTGVPVAPTPKGDQPLVKPVIQRKPETSPGPFPRGEHPQVRPIEQGKPASVPGSFPRGEQPQFRPQGQRGAGVPVAPTPKGEQPQAQPADRRKPEALPGAFPRGDRPQVQPADQGKPGFRPGSAPMGGQPQVQPSERRRPEALPGSRPRVEQPQAQSPDRRKPETLPGAFPRGDRPQVQPADQGKPGFRPGSAPIGGQLQAKPAERRKPEVSPLAVPPRSERPQALPAGQRKPESKPGSAPKEEKDSPKSDEDSQKRK